MVLETTLTLDQYLALPDEKPYREWFKGRVVEKSMPNTPHGRCAVRMVQALRNYLDESREAVLDTEVRHLDRTQGWVYLPDISVTLRGRRRAARTDPSEIAPDIAIEVLSPGDRQAQLQLRVQQYFRAGTRAVWLVDFPGRSITVFEPDRSERVLVDGDTVTAAPVLGAFHLDITRYFDTVEADLADD